MWSLDEPSAWLRSSGAGIYPARVSLRAALVVDGLRGQTGMGAFFRRWIEARETAGNSLLVLSDAPTLHFSARSVEHVKLRSLPRDLLAWCGSGGLTSRPYMTLGPPGGGSTDLALLAESVADLQAAAISRRVRDDIRRADALADGRWLEPLAHELRSALTAFGPQVVLVGTQSFLGFAAARALSVPGAPPAVHMLHVAFEAPFQRIVHLAPGANPRSLATIVDAMYDRVAGLGLRPGAPVVLPSSTAALRFRPFVARYGGHPETIVGGAVDAGTFRPRGQRSADRPFVAAFTGRLEHDKNVMLLADVAALAPEVQWRVIGDGSASAELERRMPAAAFPGFLPEAVVAAELREADVFVSPCPWETFGVAVLEAMANGLPVVVCDSGGPATFVEHGSTGLVCPPTAEAFAAALSSLRVRPAWARELGACARRHASRATWPTAFAALERQLATAGRA